MRPSRLLASLAVVVPPLLAGCGGDGTPPSVTLAGCGGSGYSRSQTCALTYEALDPESGVTLVEASNDGVTFTPIGGSPAAWTLTEGDGEKTITFRATNSAGMVTTETTQVVLDT